MVQNVPMMLCVGFVHGVHIWIRDLLCLTRPTALSFVFKDTSTVPFKTFTAAEIASAFVLELALEGSFRSMDMKGTVVTAFRVMEITDRELFSSP